MSGSPNSGKNSQRDRLVRDAEFGTPTLTPTPYAGPPSAMLAPEFGRLEGDDLFAWAKLTSAVVQAHANLNQFGEQALKRHGYTPGLWMIDDDGYIVTVAEAHNRQREVMEAQLEQRRQQGVMQAQLEQRGAVGPDQPDRSALVRHAGTPPSPRSQDRTSAPEDPDHGPAYSG